MKSKPFDVPDRVEAEVDRRIDEMWAAADPLERTLLRAATAGPRIGRGTLVRCALDRRFSPADIDRKLARLEREGILLWRDGEFTPGYSVPPDVSARIKAAARRDAIAPATSPKPMGPTADHGGAFLDDVVTTLAFLRRGAFRITRGGAVHAADLRRLAARLVYPEDVPGVSPSGPAPAGPAAPAGATVAAGGELFPSRLGFALELIRRLLFVRFEPAEVRVDDRRVREWLDRPADRVRRDLLKAARREPWRYQRELSAVADLLSERRPGDWAYLDDLARALEYHPDFLGCRPEMLRARVQSGATYLCYLGVASVAPEELFPDAVSLTPLGLRLLSDDPLNDGSTAETGRLTVLPTFEAILPASASLVARYQLEVFADAEPGPSGPVRSYRLDKRALLQAMKGSLPLESVIAFLEQQAGSLPDNVRISLEEWSRSYGEYYFMNPTLLVCRDAAAAAAAKSDPKIGERVVANLTSEILILSEGSVEPVRMALEAAGSMPRAGLEEIPPTNATTPRTPRTSSEGIDRAALIQALVGLRNGERPADAPEAAADRPAPKRCSMAGCHRPHAARGLCTLHYQSARRGKLAFPPTSSTI